MLAMGTHQPDLRWPFPDGRFPADLLAVVQRTVSDGRLPALVVVHDDEDDWLIGDGVNDPNEDGASIVCHVQHITAADPTIEDLAGLPPGHAAERSALGESWSVFPWTYPDA